MSISPAVGVPAVSRTTTGRVRAVQEIEQVMMTRAQIIREGEEEEHVCNFRCAWSGQNM